MATTNISIANVIGAGSVSSIYTGSTGAAGSGNPTWNTTYIPSSYATYTQNFTNDIVIRREGKEDIAIAKTLEMLMERLCIIEPALHLLEKYPALKEAYENYKIVEAMVKHDYENENGL